MPITPNILAPPERLRAKSSKRKTWPNRCSIALEFESRLRSAFAFPALRFIFQTFRHEARSHSYLRRLDCWIDILRAAKRAVAFRFAGSAKTSRCAREIEPAGAGCSSSAGGGRAAETKRSGPEKFGADHFNRSISPLQRARGGGHTRGRGRRSMW